MLLNIVFMQNVFKLKLLFQKSIKLYSNVKISDISTISTNFSLDIGNGLKQKNV